MLRLLVDGGELYGLELCARSDGALKRGTVYVTLGRMVDKGLLSARKHREPRHAGMPRPRYRPTALGLRLLEARRALEVAWEGAS